MIMGCHDHPQRHQTDVASICWFSRPHYFVRSLCLQNYHEKAFLKIDLQLHRTSVFLLTFCVWFDVVFCVIVCHYEVISYNELKQNDLLVHQNGVQLQKEASGSSTGVVCSREITATSAWKVCTWLFSYHTHTCTTVTACLTRYTRYCFCVLISFSGPHDLRCNFVRDN